MIFDRNGMRGKSQIELRELVSFSWADCIGCFDGFHGSLFADCSIVQLFGTPHEGFLWVTGAGGSRYLILCYYSS